MKVTLNRRELKTMTTGFSKVIANKSTLPVLSCVCFRSEGSKVTAEATDLEQTAVYSLDKSAAEGEGIILAPLALLRSLSKGSDRESVSLEHDGNNITVINNVRGHAVAQTINAVDPADWPPSGGDIRTSPAPGFLSAYNRLVPFASTDTTRMAICSVYFDTSESEATLVATDGRRLTACTGLDLPQLKESTIIPVAKFLQWTQLAEDVRIGASRSKSGLRFCIKAGAWTYRIKAYDGAYPNYRQVIPSARDTEHKLIFTEEVTSLRKLIEVFPGEKEFITFKGNPDGTVYLEGKDNMGDKDISIPLKSDSTYEGDGCCVCINRDAVLDALTAGFREFRFANNASPLLSVDSNGGTHVLMPLRINGASESATSSESAVPASESTEAAKQTTTTPAVEPPQPEPIVNTPTPKEKERNTMPQQGTSTGTNTESVELSALERMLIAYDTLKSKVRESQTAMADMAPIIRAAVKEDRKRSKEVASVRAGLQKLQSIQV